MAAFRKVRRPSASLAVVSILALVLSACGGAGSGSHSSVTGATSLSALYQAAKQEGTVNLWLTTTDPGEVKAIQDGFAKSYPGIKVVSSQLTQTAVSTKVVAEEQTHHVTSDLILVSANAAVTLLQRKLLTAQPQLAKLFDLDPSLVLEGAQEFDFYDLVQPLAYNKKLVRADEVPKTWNDLVSPKWKGKVLAEARGISFLGLGVKNGQDAMTDYIKSFLSTDKPVVVNGGTPLYQELAAGQEPLAVGTYLHNYVGPSKDPNIGYVFLNPTLVSQQNLAIPNGVAHPNAAALLLGWLVSDAGQKVRAQATARTRLYAGSAQQDAVDSAKGQSTLVDANTSNATRILSLQKAAADAMGTH